MSQSRVVRYFSLFKVLWVLANFGFFWTLCSADENRDRKRAREHSAESISHAIEQQGIQKVYIPDFVDEAGKRTDSTTFIAAQFSMLLSGRAKKFHLVDRVTVQRTYDDFKIEPSDLEKLDVLFRLASKQDAGAILWGKVLQANGSRRIEFSLLDCRSGKELFQLQHLETLGRLWDAPLPAQYDPSGRIFYFGGLDGTTMPHCFRCPNPQYTEAARRSKIRGKVVLAATFTANGTVESVRVLEGLESSLDLAAVTMMQTWRADPAKNAEGHLVTVRLPIEMTFELF